MNVPNTFVVIDFFFLIFACFTLIFCTGKMTICIFTILFYLYSFLKKNAYSLPLFWITTKNFNHHFLTFFAIDSQGPRTEKRTISFEQK